MQPLELPERRWEHVTMDLITGLPMTSRKFDAILVFVDKLTKMTHLAATTTDVSAPGVAQLFVDRVVSLHGVPRKIISDRDPRFTGKFFQAVCDILNARNALSTSFHPQTDGQTERMNRVVEETMRHYISADQSDWDIKLSLCEFAINSSYQTSTQHTPFFLNYGQDPLTPVTIHTDLHVPAARVFHDDLHEAIRLARTFLHAASQRQKAYADAGRREETFAVGEQVMLSTKNLKFKTVGTAKLLPRWIGPLAILRVISPTAVELQLPESYTIHPVFHISLLKKYKSAGSRQPVPPAPELDDDGTPSYEIEQVLNHRQATFRHKPTWEFLVKWTGYPHESNEWVPMRNFNAHHCIHDYWDTIGGEPPFRVTRTSPQAVAADPVVRPKARVAARRGGV
jgi:hypothetical protein